MMETDCEHLKGTKDMLLCCGRRDGSLQAETFNGTALKTRFHVVRKECTLECEGSLVELIVGN